MPDNQIITDLPASFIEEFVDEIRGTIPTEKAQVELRQQQNARIMAQAGPVCVEGLGQRVAEIDARLYFRLQREYGDHPGWLRDFLADNPAMCAPGYRPKRKHDLRHSMSFSGGEPIRTVKSPLNARKQA